MYLAGIVLTLLPLLCNTQSNGILQGIECTSPNGQRGSCSRIIDCPILLDLLRQSRGIQRSDTYTFLRRSQCGFEGQTPVVCCPGRDPRGVKPPVNIDPPEVTRTPPGTRAPVATGRPSSALTMPDHPNRVLLPEACGNTPSDDTIYGGINASLGQHPWLAGLEYRTFRRRYVLCGGVLISSRYVLTAAHCLRRDQNAVLDAVKLGDHDLESDPDCENTLTGPVCADPVLTVRVETFIRHPRYTGGTKQLFDIGLIRLEKSVPTTGYIKPICIPSGSSIQDNFAGRRLTVSGWGKTETSWQSRFKLYVVVPVLTNEECERNYKDMNLTLDSTQMCAGGEGGKDSCTGDSGGPLMRFSDKWFVTGIVSIGPQNCGTQGQPGVYTRVGPFVTWILDNLKP